MTERSRAVVDAVVASFPLAVRPRAVGDASTSLSSLPDSTKRQQLRPRNADVDLFVNGQYCVSGGVVVFAPLQFVLLIVVRLSIANSEEGKGGIESPTNTLSKSSSNAAGSTIVLFTNDSVERLYRVSATAALARVTTVTRPPCLGAGAVA